MTNGISSASDPALQPAAAATRSIDAGAEATRKALDGDHAAGREAVQQVGKAENAAPVSPEPKPQTRGKLVDRTA